MTQFRRIAAASILLAALTALAPTPAAAAPWRTGFEDVAMKFQWRVMHWVIQHVANLGITNATAAEGAKLQP
jgi:hypothetical protein